MPSFSWARWRVRAFPALVKPRRQARATRQLQVEHLETRLAPATFTWSGGAGTGNWGTAANWQNQQAPTGNGDDLVFPSGPSVLNTHNDLTGATFNSISDRRQRLRASAGNAYHARQCRRRQRHQSTVVTGIAGSETIS